MTLQERVLRLWDQALWWMHLYLAFDVQPRARRGDDPTGVTPQSPGEPQRRAEPEAMKLQDVKHTPSGIPIFAPGDRIADVYDVQRILSADDMSTVYVARQRHWKIDLVVKIPSPQLVSVRGALEQFAARIEQWVAIGPHPHIASCYELHWMDGVPFAVVELVSGGNLRHWMEQRPDAGLRERLDLAVQVCRGLQHAHSRGICHGQLTAENVLVGEQETVKLTDFGGVPTGSGTRSSRSESSTALSVWRLMRSPAYVAPERWSNPTNVETAADVFALGVCLYELFCGCVPYETTGAARQRPPDARELRRSFDVPESLAVLLKHCVEWNPRRRPAGVEDVARELSELYEALFGNAADRTADQAALADEWNDKAVAYLDLGNQADADAAWESALAADHTHLDAHFNRGVALWRRGALADDALLRRLEEVPVRREQRPKLRYLLALVHLERGDGASATGLLENAAREQPAAPEVAATLAQLRSTPEAAHRSACVLARHSEYVSAVGLSADGSLAVSGSHDGTAALWEVPSGRRRQLFEGHSAPVSCAAITPDGRRVLTGSDDRTLRLWDAETGTCLHVYEGGAGRISCACLRGDARFLLWAGTHTSETIEVLTLQLWDAQTGRLVRKLEGHGSTVKAVCFSPDGRWAVSGSDDQSVRFWEVATGQCVREFDGHTHFVSAACITNDARMILSGSWDQTLRLWNVQDGSCLRIFRGHTALITAVALSADGRWAVSGGLDCTVRVWEVATGRCVRTFAGHTSLVTSVALSGDDRALSGSWDGTVRLWDMPREIPDYCKPRRSFTGTR